MKLVTSVTLDKEVAHKAKILAKLDGKSFSELVNQILGDVVEVEEYRISEFERIANAPQTRVH